jgi:HNH endonuclease
VHWRDGGETDLDNLILLCGRHHRLLHEQHWQLCGRLSQPESVEFRRPDGRAITPYRPPVLDPAVRERFLVSVS